MGFQLDVSVPVLTVFTQGLLSFFSPCVLPLLPLYIGYLSGGTMKQDENGNLVYDRKKVMLNTLFFVIGISFAFFILGFGVSVLGQFFKSNQAMFAKIGGIIIVLFGFYQLGFLGTSKVMATERRVRLPFEKLVMSPWVALLMGFTFSFAWTPCVGPILASVLLMTASAASVVSGFLLIGVYTLGFVLPFLAVGIFTTSILAFFKKYRGVVQYTVKIGGVLLIAMGLMIFTGKMNAITGYLSSVTSKPSIVEEEKNESAKENISEIEDTSETEEANEKDTIEALDFTLTDQFGVEHTLSDYKGKTVFLNFWATWCPPCRAEMPDIQELFEEYGENEGEELIVLGIAAPDYGSEKSQEGITEFLEQNGYNYPVLMDTTGDIFNRYGIMSYPTTFMIDKDGNIFGYVSGALNKSTMKSIIRQTMDGVRD